MKYVLRADQPFAGHVQSVLKDDGTVAYTNGLTLEQYAADRGFPVRVIDDSELDALCAAYVTSLITEPREETKAQWWYALEVLPPSKWRTVHGVEMFHICERITHDLVSWHARIGDRYLTWNGRASTPADEIAAKASAALAQSAKDVGLC